MHLGTLILQSNGEVEILFHNEIHNEDHLIKDNHFDSVALTDPLHICGYGNGRETAIDSTPSTFIPFEFEMEEKTGIITGRFLDGGKAIKEYQVKVFLLVEEYPVVIKESQS